MSQGVGLASCLPKTAWPPTYKGVAELDPAKRADIYKEANQLYYDLAVGTPLEVSTSHAFRQRWVQGEVLNPIFPDVYF